MKKWKIDIDEKISIDKLVQVLKKYTTSLNEDTNGVLNGTISCDLVNDRFQYNFYIHGKVINYKLFLIELINLDEQINLTIKYFNTENTISTSIDKLEERIDEVIQDTKIGNLLNHLIKIETNQYDNK